MTGGWNGLLREVCTEYREKPYRDQFRFVDRRHRRPRRTTFYVLIYPSYHHPCPSAIRRRGDHPNSGNERVWPAVSHGRLSHWLPESQVMSRPEQSSTLSRTSSAILRAIHQNLPIRPANGTKTDRLWSCTLLPARPRDEGPLNKAAITAGLFRTRKCHNPQVLLTEFAYVERPAKLEDAKSYRETAAGTTRIR